MGSKGGDQTRPVFDYHLSIDYGVCSGEIDHFNKGWIKDKSIFCGKYSVRTDLEIGLPQLFGGDDAEGGVKGVVELYTGAELQVSSWELSKRLGLTPINAPGYRGLAHMFFRGALDADVIDGEIEEANADDSLASIIDSLIYTVFIQEGNAGGSSARHGWMWTSNNPYLPALKASVTRLPRKGLIDAYDAIWPAARIDDDGNLAGLASVIQETTPDVSITDGAHGEFDVGLANGGLVDLYEVGFTQTQIDAGDALIDAAWLLTALSYDTSGLGDLTCYTNVRFYSAFPDFWDSATQVAPVLGEETDVADVQVFELAGGERDRGDIYPAQNSVTVNSPTVTAPVGSRYVRVQALFAAATGVTVQTPAESGNYHDEWLYDNPNAGYTPGSYGLGAINVYDTSVPGPDPEPPADTAVAPPDDYEEIYIAGQLTINETPPTKLGVVVDLVAAGFPEEAIDSGLLYVSSSWTGVTYQSIPALPDGNSLTSSSISFYDENDGAPVNWYDASMGGGVGWSEGPTGGSTHSHSSGAIPIPAGARWVQLRNSYTPAVGQTTQVDTNSWFIAGLSYGPQWCATDDLLGPLPDANPARIIYDCLVNEEWGKGEDPALIDDTAFDAAAATLYTERFGLSFAFFEQDSIENFISEVLDHIQGFLFQDPTTGLWTLTLLRDDYDAGAAPLLDETNCVATDRKRRLWGETINEIVVSWTDPQTEKQATVAAHDLGNIAIQGAVISETREYYGVRNALLAQVIAYRDVQAAGYPLFSCNIEVDRSEWNARPGDVRRFSWPDDQINEIVVRVMAVDYGKPTDRTIRLTVTEDIFSIERASYGAPQTTEWVNVEQPPSPADVQAAFTAPLPALVRSGQSIDDIDAGDPGIVGAIFADEDGNRPDTIEVWAEVVKANGSTATEQITVIAPTTSALLMVALPQEAESTIRKSQIDAILNRNGEEGQMFMLGFQEATSEIIMLDTYNSTTREWTVKRGMWDTVPLEWPSGVRLWNFAGSATSIDTKARESGDTVTYYLLPRTSLGVLPFEDSVPLTVTYRDRPFAPFRPADAQLDGNGFGGVIDRPSTTTSIEATWKNRNRTSEDQVALAWDDASVAVEAGQTVTLRILDDLGNEHDTITGLTGESHTIDAVDLPLSLEGYIEFLSVRDGFTSLWGARRYFDIRPATGYGLAYGYDYGQSEGFVTVAGRIRADGDILTHGGDTLTWNG